VTDFPIQHDAAAQRFTTTVDGAQCELNYHLREGRDGTVLSIDHTGVPQAVGGRGIASALVTAAFALARQRQWKVDPACSYAATWAQRHADVADLLA
jgi:hypothetical protein